MEKFILLIILNFRCSKKRHYVRGSPAWRAREKEAEQNPFMAVLTVVGKRGTHNAGRFVR